MKVIEYTSTIASRTERIQLVPLGDIHLGTKNCAEDLLQETIDYIKKTRNCYTVLMGDLIDAINISDKRFDGALADWVEADSLTDLVKCQADKIIEYLKPIRYKIIGSLEGNHENTIRKRYLFSVADYIATALGVPNLTYCCMIRWHLKRKTAHPKTACKDIVIYANHGCGGGHYIGSKVNKLIRSIIGFDADIYLMGHVHDKLVHEIPRLQLHGRDDNLRLYDNKRYVVLTGTFLRAYKEDSRSYGEAKMYNPTSLGVMHINIKPFPTTHIEGKKVEMPPEIRVSQ